MPAQNLQDLSKKFPAKTNFLSFLEATTQLPSVQSQESAQQQKNKINLSAYFMSTRTEILTIQTQRQAEIFTESVLPLRLESDFLNLQISILKDRKSIQKTSVLSVAATLILAKKL